MTLTIQHTKLNIQLLKLNVHSTLKIASTIKIKCQLSKVIQLLNVFINHSIHKVDSTIKIECHLTIQHTKFNIQLLKLNVILTIQHTKFNIQLLKLNVIEAFNTQS